MSIVIKKKKDGTRSYKAIIRKGKYRTKPISQTFPTRSEAEYWKAEQYRLIDMKLHKDPRLAEMVTLEAALDKYREHGELILKKAATTLERERTSRNNIERILGKDTSLDKISPKVVSDYQTRRIAEGASNSSIRQELAMLSRMYRTARTTWEVPVQNPVDDIERVPPAPGRERFLSDKEAKIVIEETKKARNKKFTAYVLLLLHTGMRASEAASLTTNQVDFKKRLIRIEITKTKKKRVIGLSDEAAEALEKVDPEKDDYFFLKPHHRETKSTILHPDTVFRKAWEYLKIRIKRQHPDFEDFTPHDLRHTAGSHLLRQGVDIRIIADILGHSTLSMVMRYTHIFDESRTKYANMISYLGIEENAEGE